MFAKSANSWFGKVFGNRILLRILAYVSLAIGLIGIIVPGLPTTEFVLLSAWAAAKSSPKLHHWLVNHKVFGPSIQAWQDHGCISLRVKCIATLSMLVCWLLMLVYVNHVGSLVASAIGMSLGAIWMWRRPSEVQCK